MEPSPLEHALLSAGARGTYRTEYAPEMLHTQPRPHGEKDSNRRRPRCLSTVNTRRAGRRGAVEVPVNRVQPWERMGGAVTPRPAIQSLPTVAACYPTG